MKIADNRTWRFTSAHLAGAPASTLEVLHEEPGAESVFLTRLAAAPASCKAPNPVDQESVPMLLQGSKPFLDSTRLLAAEQLIYGYVLMRLSHRTAESEDPSAPECQSTLARSLTLTIPSIRPPAEVMERWQRSLQPELAHPGGAAH